MQKSNVKNIFHIPRWPVGVSNHMVLREFPDCAITYHMPAHSRQSERQNIIDRTHIWQQCSVTISEDILTTKYAFNLRLISSITTRILWLDLACRTCANRSVQSLKLAYFWSDICWSPPPPLSPTIHSVAWFEKGQGNSLKCNSASASQSGGIPAHGVMTVVLCLLR